MGFFHTIFLFDGFRPVRASLFGNTQRGEVSACGRGERIPTPVCGLARNDNECRQAAGCGHPALRRGARGAFVKRREGRVVRPYARLSMACTRKGGPPDGGPPFLFVFAVYLQGKSAHKKQNATLSAWWYLSLRGFTAGSRASHSPRRSCRPGRPRSRLWS